MKQISLTQNKFAQVDDEDFESMNQFKWYAYINRNTFYARRDSKGSFYLLHREIMKAKKGELIDHVDRNGLNCQRDNLRKATHSQNNMNKIKKQNCSSKYIGVRSSQNKWRADIQINKKKIFIGTFETENEAGIAYNNKAIELHREFANLNNIH